MEFITVFLIGVVLLLVAVGGMALGVMFGRKPISGSCGGFANGIAGGGCSMCSRRDSCQEAGQDSPQQAGTGEAGDCQDASCDKPECANAIAEGCSGQIDAKAQNHS
jgi:uncharacterized protein